MWDLHAGIRGRQRVAERRAPGPFRLRARLRRRVKYSCAVRNGHGTAFSARFIGRRAGRRREVHALAVHRGRQSTTDHGSVAK